MKSEIKAAFNDQVTEHEMKNRHLSRQIATEGIVLLKNDGTLPLNESCTKIALYGNGGRRTIYGGTGSGEVNSREQVSIEQGLLNAGVQITTNDWLNRYESQWIEGKQAYIKEGKAKLKKISTVILAELISSEYEYPFGDEISENDIIKSDTDTCIYVISRQSGEGKDRTLTEGSYYLSQIELTNIKKCAAAYQKCIVIINTGAPISIGELHGMEGVHAIVYMSQLGMESGNALADILFGHETPSGHLAATWVKSYDDIPSGREFGANVSNTNNISYSEGIYVGYRYYHTHHIKTQYPFGFGLSYTNFTTHFEKVFQNEKEIRCIVTIINSGSKYSGKEVVGIYAEGPATETDRPKKQLIAIGKTEKLMPLENQQLEIQIPIERFSIFSESRGKTIIEAGVYKLFAGTNVDTCEFITSVNIEKEIICYDHTKSAPVKSSEETTIPKEIQKLLENMHAKDLIELCVGNGLFLDGKGNVVPGSAGSTSTKFLNRGVPNAVMCDGPAGIRLSRRSTINKNGKIKPLDYPLSLYELLPDFISRLIIGNPDKGTIIYQFVTGFPVATAVAQTWNTALAHEMGEAVGKEMQEYGIDCWLAPALNIIRNPLCGRNYEYYSEDPVLSAYMASAVTKGVQKIPGRYVTLKHFACNNQETNRYYMSSNLSERTLREIYLKGFEIAVKEAHPKAIMTAYNKINGTYAAENRELLENILRREWSFDGLIMTDWLSVGKDRADEAASISAGIDLIMPGSRKNKKKLFREYKNGAVKIESLRRAAANVLRMVQKL
ncbi:MAG: glycoside hydrolase family 3 C-terminal domain-containing protein [Lachnospiraceae bacterium]|nr:glycoside hydrolase family 3 C-terminal domain-containing protein [Lachnospiraceae bacterium]